MDKKETILANSKILNRACNEYLQVALEEIATIAEKHNIDKDVLLFSFLDYGIRSYYLRHSTLWRNIPSFNNDANWVDKDAVLNEVEHSYISRVQSIISSKI